eukprot:306072-Amphidinium_carterae.1
MCSWRHCNARSGQARPGCGCADTKHEQRLDTNCPLESHGKLASDLISANAGCGWTRREFLRHCGDAGWKVRNAGRCVLVQWTRSATLAITQNTFVEEKPAVERVMLDVVLQPCRSWHSCQSRHTLFGDSTQLLAAGDDELERLRTCLRHHTFTQYLHKQLVNLRAMSPVTSGDIRGGVLEGFCKRSMRSWDKLVPHQGWTWTWYAI